MKELSKLVLGSIAVLIVIAIISVVAIVAVHLLKWFVIAAILLIGGGVIFKNVVKTPNKK